MSLTEIMSELPNLTKEQREQIATKISEMDGDVWLGSETDPATRAEIDQRLAEIKQGNVTWSSWREAKGRISERLRAG